MQLPEPPLIEVEPLDLEPGLQQVVRKRLAHEAHADDTDALSHGYALLTGAWYRHDTNSVTSAGLLRPFALRP